MATMKNRASSSSSFFTYGWTYDVFISFRGADTRLGFTGNLYMALCGKEIKAFMDDQDLEPGAEISEALDKAIQESRTALVIFSKNYAASSFCLEELVKIIECSNVKGMLVWPVFYQVQPSDVRHQKGSYAEALVKHEGRYKTEKIEMWRAALTNAAGRSGLEFRSDGYQYEHQFIAKIIEVITKKISSLSTDGDHKNQIFYNVDDDYIAQHDRQPKPQSSSFTYRGVEVEHLLDKRIHYNKTSHKYKDLTTLKIAFRHATKNDVVVRTIRLPKQSEVRDVINDLKSKLDLSDPAHSELRLLGVSGHTTKIFSLDEKIENIIKYETLRAEEIREVNKNLGTGDKLIHVYHFKTNNGEIQNFGDPFVLTIRKDDKLINIKLQIQQKFRVPYDEISKWRFATVRFNHAEYLEDLKYPDSLFNRFKSGSTYGDWEQYLGLEH